MKYMALMLSALLLATLSSADAGLAGAVSLDGGVVEDGSTVAEDQRLEAASASALVGGVSSASSLFTLSAAAEALYQWNFNDPSNGLTAWRGFDNRHNTFTISNVMLDVAWDYRGVVGRAALQVGHTPSSYYSAEPGRSGASGVNSTGQELWKFVQQAFAGYRFPVGRGLLVQAGIFLSPIGPEAIAVRDNWNWSRSTLFFALPYYHTGVRASLPVSERWAVTLAGYNGWNSVVDNNAEKSISLQATYSDPDRLALSFLYFGGVERQPGAPEGRAFRQLLDAHATWVVSSLVSVLGHLSGGLEPNAVGLSAWIAGSLAARVTVRPWLLVAARGDLLHERWGAAAPLFFGVPVVGSVTATADVRPHERVSFRLEFRRDMANSPIYFAGRVEGDGVTTPWVPTRSAQDTLTLGVTTWF
jgi:hypothetical protein